MSWKSSLQVLKYPLPMNDLLKYVLELPKKVLSLVWLIIYKFSVYYLQLLPLLCMVQLSSLECGHDPCFQQTLNFFYPRMFCAKIGWFLRSLYVCNRNE